MSLSDLGSRLSYLETVERSDQNGDGGRQADGPRRSNLGE